MSCLDEEQQYFDTGIATWPRERKSFHPLSRDQQQPVIPAVGGVAVTGHSKRK